MKIRQVLILIVSALILISFAIISSISYDMGVDYGEENAETIRLEKKTDSVDHEKTIKLVSVTKVNNSNISNEIVVSGRVISENNISISSEVSGKIIGNYSIKKGTQFKKGSILFKVKSTEMKLLLDSRKSKLMNSISAHLADIKLDFPEEYTKWDQFFNSINLQDNLSAFPETNSSKEKNFITSRGILSDYLLVKSDEEKLRKYTIRAPFDGIILRSHTDIGSNINMGSPVIDIIRKGQMEIELSVNTSENKFISVGNTVELNNGTKTYTATVIRKGNFVNNNTQNISVFAKINSENQQLYNGMYLEGTIITNENNNVCKIERRSLFSDNKVYIVNQENKLEVKEINIISYQGNFMIIDNLQNNTLVVNEPLINEKEGTTVNPIIK
jgi:multidrug efflux pump subunit AcrA (membrane-fusion protein)